MKHTISLIVPLVLFASSMAYADCRTYTGGLTECSGPRGYQSSQRDYTGGVSESYDNRGNRATIRHYTGGYTSVEAPTGVAPSVPAAGGSGSSYGGGGGGLNVGSKMVPYRDPFAR